MTCLLNRSIQWHPQSNRSKPSLKTMARLKCWTFYHVLEQKRASVVMPGGRTFVSWHQTDSYLFFYLMSLISVTLWSRNAAFPISAIRSTVGNMTTLSKIEYVGRSNLNNNKLEQLRNRSKQRCPYGVTMVIPWTQWMQNQEQCSSSCGCIFSTSVNLI